MSSEIATILETLGTLEFIAGFTMGAVTLLALLVLPTTRRYWGLAIAAGTIAGINLAQGATIGATLGVGGLALGGALLDRSDGDKWTAWTVLVAGALAISIGGGVERPAWLQLATPSVILGGGYLLSQWGPSSRYPLIGTMFAVTAGGIWLTVPDTETARVLLGASIALAVATFPHFSTRLSSSGSFALVGIVAWISATGGIGREASIIGGWACLGIFLILPFLGVDRPGLGNRATAVLHILVVVVASRVVGLWESPAVVAMAAIVAAGVLCVVAIRVVAPEIA